MSFGGGGERDRVIELSSNQREWQLFSLDPLVSWLSCASSLVKVLLFLESGWPARWSGALRACGMARSEAGISKCRPNISSCRKILCLSLLELSLSSQQSTQLIVYILDRSAAMSRKVMTIRVKKQVNEGHGCFHIDTAKNTRERKRSAKSRSRKQDAISSCHREKRHCDCSIGCCEDHQLTCS